MKRDIAIDYARGFAVFSMVLGHFAAGSHLSKPFHASPHFDGASVFVLMSGVLLGLVHRSWGPRTSLTRLIKRSVVLYVCQFLICFVAVGISVTRGPVSNLIPVNSWTEGLRYALMLQYMPPGGDILTLYFVLMVGSIGVIAALRRGHSFLILGVSALLYVVSQISDSPVLYLANHSGLGVIVSWAAWQALFVPALVLGWNWTGWRVRERLMSALPTLLGASVVIAIASIAIGRTTLVPSLVGAGDKVEFGPLRLLAAWILGLSIYVLLSHIGERRFLRPWGAVGGRSLDSYLIQALLVLLIPLVAARPWGQIEGTLIALSVFGVCWAWAESRIKFNIVKLHNPARWTSSRT